MMYLQLKDEPIYNPETVQPANDAAEDDVQEDQDLLADERSLVSSDSKVYS